MNPNQSCHVSWRGCRTQIHSAPLFIHSKKTCSVEEWSHISDKEFLFLTLQVLCCRNRCGFVFPASKGNHLQVGDTEDRPPFINIESVIFIGWLDGWMEGQRGNKSYDSCPPWSAETWSWTTWCWTLRATSRLQTSGCVRRTCTRAWTHAPSVEPQTTSLQRWDLIKRDVLKSNCTVCNQPIENGLFLSVLTVSAAVI